MLKAPVPAPADPAAFLIVQFLGWVAARERGYAETMSAWRTSCPRLQVWEEATEAGLVRIEYAEGATQSEARVALTEAGRAALAASSVAQWPGGR
ncbi:hypothetical protein [Elioraea rosea]|uniref:hypothetical protein n=1 Tax=Elioraea rosea TaxID=2492390 RepID=UPI001182227D|nr:hypothetical protein [Elioraea rosea]